MRDLVGYVFLHISGSGLNRSNPHATAFGDFLILLTAIVEELHAGLYQQISPNGVPLSRLLKSLMRRLPVTARGFLFGIFLE